MEEKEINDMLTMLENEPCVTFYYTLDGMSPPEIRLSIEDRYEETKLQVDKVSYFKPVIEHHKTPADAYKYIAAIIF